MRLSVLAIDDTPLLAVRSQGHFFAVAALCPQHPKTLEAWLAAGETVRAELENSLVSAPSSAQIHAPFRYLPLAAATSKIICLGLNYRAHAAEASYEEPQYPVVFSRYPSSLVGHEAPLVLPRTSTQLDFEAELAVIIGRSARYVAREHALTHVAGYSIFNDGSLRDYQKRTHQWTLGKNFDRTGPLGPELVTADEVPPGATDLRIQMRVNGETLQDANTRDMIFGVAETIAVLSEALTLEPGDVIAMGTPSGVGAARTPPRFLQAGDVCEVEIEKLGVLRNVVTPEDADPR